MNAPQFNLELALEAQAEKAGVLPDAPFDGPAYDPALDHARLKGQIMRVFMVMRRGAWMTLGEIARVTGDPESSISAQLRHLRKEKFGSHQVDKRRRGNDKSGLWEYQLTIQDQKE